MKSQVINRCRELVMGDLTIGHRKISREHLTVDDWRQVYYAYLAFQYQIKLIVATVRARSTT